MTIPEQVRALQTVADGREWFRVNGHTLNSAEHVAFINRMAALIKLESHPGNP